MYQLTYIIYKAQLYMCISLHFLLYQLALLMGLIDTFFVKLETVLQHYG